MSIFAAELKYAILVLLLSMTPIIELRGSIPLGAAYGLPILETLLLSVIGNMILTPFIILFTRRILGWFKKIKSFQNFADRVEKRILSKKKLISKYEMIGLAILVAIPLPGTGAWTGAMLAGLMNMRIKNALPPIFLGVIVAAGIVAGVSYGFLGAIDFLGLHA